MYDNGARLRVRSGQWAFTKEEGYGLASLLLKHDFIQEVFTSHRNGSILIYHDGETESKQKIFRILNGITMDDLFEAEPTQTQVSKEITDDFYLKLSKMIGRRLLGRWFLPLPIKNALTLYRAVRYVWGGFDSLSGTSFAAPVITGYAAQLMEWGIVCGNSPFMYGERVKAEIRLRAQRSRELTYPDPSLGYGRIM